MKEIKEHKLLIVILFFLLAAKFIVVPVFSWQSESIEEISLLAKRINKSDSAVQNLPDIKLQLEVMDANLSILSQHFFAYEEENSFQLKQQKWLEQQLAANNLTVLNLGWQPLLPLKKWQLLKHEVQLHFSGETLDLQSFLLDLEMQQRWINNHNFNYRFEQFDDKKLGKMTGRITLRFYMREAEA